MSPIQVSSNVAQLVDALAAVVLAACLAGIGWIIVQLVKVTSAVAVLMQSVKQLDTENEAHERRLDRLEYTGRHRREQR